jgi:hypothetical protein
MDHMKSRTLDFECIVTSSVTFKSFKYTISYSRNGGNGTAVGFLPNSVYPC